MKSFLTGLATTSPYAPLLMTALTAVAYILVDYQSDTGFHFKVPAGALALSLAAWAAAGAVVARRLAVHSAIPRLYLGLLPYVADLRSAVEKVPEPTDSLGRVALSRIELQLSELELMLEVRPFELPSPTVPPSAEHWDWRSGAGYHALYRRIHAIESDLLLVQPRDVLVAAAVEDYARLQDSGMSERAYWQFQIYSAALKLGGDAATLLQPPPPGATPAATAAIVTVSVDEARSQLRIVRRVLNDFRDSGFAALLRQQSQTHITLISAGLLVYFALMISVIAHVDWTRVAGGTAMFLIAALVGVSSRIINQQDDDASVEDYGLGVARQVQSVALSGIAGILGVIVTIYGFALGASSDLGGNSGGTAPALVDLFDLNAHPTHLLVAAIFGLTPQLLLSRLDDIAGKIKGSIKSAEST